MKQHDLKLHISCETSQKGNAGAVNVSIEIYDNLQANVQTAKTKVEPVKVISMHRIELCTAEPGTDLCSTTKKILGLKDVFA